MTTATRPAAAHQAAVQLLNEHLASVTDLASQLKQAHWSIVGHNFIALHKLFDEEVALARGYSDEYAERVRALGGETCGTVRDAAAASRLQEFPKGVLDWQEVVKALVERFEHYSEMLTEGIQKMDEAKDLTTQDIFIEAQREIDRHAWFLRSHLEG